MKFGVQIATNYGIIQVVYNTEFKELHCQLRRSPSKKFPVLKLITPKGKNYVYELYAASERVGYAVVDDDEFGEVDVFRSGILNLRLQEHHSSLGLEVMKQPKIILHKEDARR